MFVETIILGFQTHETMKKFINNNDFPIKMEKRKIKKTIFLSLVMVVLIILLILMLNQPSSKEASLRRQRCPQMISTQVFAISIFLVIFIAVLISHHITSKKLEDKMEKNLNAITKLVNSSVKVNGKANKSSKKVNRKSKKPSVNGSILKLLSSNEKKVIQRIIENKGTTLQSEISRMEDMTKLKAHRTVKELERKGVIKIEQFGKTNKLILNKDFKDIMPK